MSTIHSHTSARVARASTVLADQQNAKTIAAQMKRISALEFVIKSLRRISRERLRWIAEEGEELVVATPAGPAVLHSLLEQRRYEDWSVAVASILSGCDPLYLCDYCRHPECGSTHTCGRAQCEATAEGMTPEQLARHQADVRVPHYVRAAARQLATAERKAEESING